MQTPATMARALMGFGGGPLALRSSLRGPIMAKDQQGLELAGAPEFGRRVRSRDRRLLRADRRSGRRSQIRARPRSRLCAGRRGDRGAHHDRRLSRRPSGGGRARSARPKRELRAPRSASGAISPRPRPGRAARPRRPLPAGSRSWPIIRPTRSRCASCRTPISFSAGRPPFANAPSAPCRIGLATIRSRALSSAFTPSGSRRRAISGAPRTSAVRRSPAIRATPGRPMRWPM